MLFDSPAYFLFLIPVVLLYWRLNHRAQNIYLLLASYFFYGWWDWRFLALMIGSTTVDFLVAQKIAPGRSDPNRKKWFIFSLILNFTILGIFKYFDFFAGSFVTALAKLGVHDLPLPLIRIILPPGISFYTFQEVAYIVDVYKGRIEASKSFFEYGLFISLFPHLIAGPIQRPGHLLPQVQKPRTLDADRFFDGAMLIFSGLIRKCVIADNCAVLANAVFGALSSVPFMPVVEPLGVTEVNAGKFCRLLAPTSPSQGSLGMTPAPSRTIPKPEFEKIEFRCTALPTPVPKLEYRNTPPRPLKATTLPDPLLVPPIELLPPKMLIPPSALGIASVPVTSVPTKLPITMFRVPAT